MLIILEHERLIQGIPGLRKEFDDLKQRFVPHNELWETVHEIETAKKDWFKSKLKDIVPDEVDNLVRQKTQSA